MQLIGGRGHRCTAKLSSPECLIICFIEAIYCRENIDLMSQLDKNVLKELLLQWENKR